MEIELGFPIKGNMTVRSSLPEVFCKKGALRNFLKFTGKHLCQSLFFKKEALAQVSPCEFCEISKNIFSYRTLPMTASGQLSNLNSEIIPESKKAGVLYLNMKKTT